MCRAIRASFCDLPLRFFYVNVQNIMAVVKIDKSKLSPVNIDERKKLDFSSGDTVKVWSKVLDDKGKTRLQAFEGIVLARKHGTEIGATFTIRRIASGVGVERIFPLYSPNLDKIEITKKSRARKSKLYYIREKALKDVRRKLRSVVSPDEEAVGADVVVEKE